MRHNAKKKCLLQGQLEDMGNEKQRAEESLQQEIQALKASLAQTQSDKDSTEQQLTSDIDSIHKNMLGTVFTNTYTSLKKFNFVFTIFRINAVINTYINM